MADSPPTAGGRRRLVCLGVTAALGALLLGLYLFGPIWPGTIGRLQIATREGWGWAGPAELHIAAEPAAAWIELRAVHSTQALEGRGAIRAKIGAGTYHCRVGLEGYTTQEFEVWCPPDGRVTRRVTLERTR
jgi:hypothetical protein